MFKTKLDFEFLKVLAEFASISRIMSDPAIIFWIRDSQTTQSRR